ncbi:MAG: 4-hydroxy-3-methylbut-2-enyl diphosphate reductase [Clostridia bacterium]|nr:4-hydroxy-3-methylbut-2-enyl diphosphate reductase [Clostridia bacterium]
MIEVTLAKSAGFCYGVKRAVNLTNEALQEYDELYSKGNVVNNKNVVDDLESKGLKRFCNVSELNKNSNVLIRAHGITCEELNEYEQLRCNIVDATCPNVKKIHEIVKKYANTDYEIIIIGDKSHPEVLGIASYGGCYVDIISNEDEVKKYNKVCVVEQTTFSKEYAQKIIDKISLASKEQIIYNTICEATSTRQNDVKELAKTHEMVVVVGDKESANSNRLYEIAKAINKNTIFIEDANQINISEFSSYSKIGITAGASTPDEIIKNVIDKIKGEITIK